MIPVAWWGWHIYFSVFSHWYAELYLYWNKYGLDRVENTRKIILAWWVQMWLVFVNLNIGLIVLLYSSTNWHQTATAPILAEFVAFWPNGMVQHCGIYQKLMQSKSFDQEHSNRVQLIQMINNSRHLKLCQCAVHVHAW